MPRLRARLTVFLSLAAAAFLLLTTISSATLKHEHDPLGNTAATTLPGGQTLNWLYYGSGHLHQINIDGQVISDIERDALHREVQRTQGSIDTQWQPADG